MEHSEQGEWKVLRSEMKTQARTFSTNIIGKKFVF